MAVFMENFRYLGRHILIPILFIVLFFEFYLVYNDIRKRTIHEFTNEQLILAETASRGISSFFVEYQSYLEFLAQISDTGIGIPEEKRHRVFERFVQLHDEDNANYSGTGLGLAIVKGLIELMEGKIWFESESGKGTIFHFQIPN